MPKNPITAEIEPETIVLDPDDAEFRLDSNADDDALLSSVLAFYHRALLQSPDFPALLADFGVTADKALEVARQYNIGLADRTLGLTLPSRLVKAGKAIRSRLDSLGILRMSGHEHLAGSFAFPITDAQGKVVQVYGHKVNAGKLRTGTIDDLFLPGAVPTLWNEAVLVSGGEVVLVGHIMDGIALISLGIANVIVQIGGTHRDVVERIHSAGVRSVRLAHTRTDAWEKLAEALALPLMEHGIECWRVLFPLRMSVVLAAKHKRGMVEDAVREAKWLGKSKTPTTPPEQGVLKALQQASPLPPALSSISSPAPVHSIVGEDVQVQCGDRSYRIRGLLKNTAADVVRVNLRVLQGDGCHVDSLDLYHARHRVAFINAAADELKVQSEVIKRDLGKLILVCEQVLDARNSEVHQQSLSSTQQSAPKMDPVDEDEALSLLKDKNLMDRILKDFAQCGVVGEESNKLMGYLAAISRKLDNPLAIVIQSSSAAGKTSLMDAILAFVPEEDLVQFSAMTGQSLYYMAENGLKHRVLAIAEEAGMEQASYALKLLQSAGELRIASTGKDSSTGRLTTQTYSVEGPVALFLTTTAIEVDEELVNRCIVLTVSEDREHTRAVHVAQRMRSTIEGMLGRGARDSCLKVHRNAQRLLRPMLVANPYAPLLTFPDDRTRTRRDHGKYLTLIQAVALLHQYQRETRSIEHDGKQVSFIEATIQDIEFANRLAHRLLGRSLDEVPPQTRRLLHLIDEMVSKACATKAIHRSDFRFTRRDVREAICWGHTQLKIHLRRLEEMEWLLVHRGEHGRSIVYELAYDGQGQDGTPMLPGLIDTSKLTSKSGGGRAIVGGESVGCRGEEICEITEKSSILMKSVRKFKNTDVGESKSTAQSNTQGALEVGGV